MSIVGSQSVLNNLYGSLVSNNVQSACVNYLNKLDLESHTLMSSKINEWLNSSAPQASIGLSPTTKIPQLRVQVIEADGTPAFYTYKIVNFDTKDNEVNVNTRSYNMGAALSQSGMFCQIKYSNTVNSRQIYLAVRQGNTSEPLGNIVISMNM